MTLRRTAAVTLASGLIVSALASAEGASAKSKGPTATAATAALERRVERTYRDEFRHGDAESVSATCRRTATHRREVQFSCRWRIVGDPFDDARYDVERPAGTATVFASIKTPRRYRFLAMRGADV